MVPEMIAALYAAAPLGGNRSRSISTWLTIALPSLWVVGCIHLGKWADDTVANSSRRGPTVGGRNKPDIGAPGTNILSAAHDWDGGLFGLNAARR